MKRTLSILLALLVAGSVLLTGCKDIENENVTEETFPVIEPITLTEESTTAPTMATTKATTTESTTTEETTTTTEEETTTEETTTTETTTATSVTEDTSAPLTASYIVSKMSEAATATAAISTPAADPNAKLTCIKGSINKGYGYKQLTASEQALYDAIYNAALNLDKTVSLSCDKQSWYKMYSMVLNQEPELFFLSTSITSEGVMHYLYTDPATIEKMQGEINAKASQILAQVNACPTTSRKLRYLNDYICTSSSYDPNSKNLYTILVQGKAQCVSYAKCVQYLCDTAGIESMVITGINAEGTAHAWNIVNVDGVYYNFDATWNDPAGSTFFTNNFVRYNFFLAPDAWLHNLTHFKINTAQLGSYNVTYFTPPQCTQTAKSYFVEYGRYATDNASADALMKKAIKEGTASKVECIQVMTSTTATREYLDANCAVYMDYAKQVSPYPVKEVRKYNDKNMNVFYVVVVYN